MNRKSYYDVGMNDFEYFKHVMCANLEFPSYNGIAVQAQQIVEKMLKFLLCEYCTEEDNTDSLRSHKLVNLYTTITEQGVELSLNKDDLRFLTDFYFDAQNPGNDYIVVTLEDAKRAIRIVEEVVGKVKRIKDEYKL